MQIFHPSANAVAKLSIIAVVTFVVGLVGLIYLIVRSSYVTEVNVAVRQPVPFSHEHHVSGLGVDCRYCHVSVENSSYAGVPPTETCMTCHSQIWNDSPMLAPVRASYETNTPLTWNRVHNLPDHVYFNHSIHVQKGVGCVTCHGRVDQMPLTWKAEAMTMSWCLDCHRRPEQFLRPVEAVFDMEWQPSEQQLVLGRRLIGEYDIRVEQLTDCYICHR